MQQDNFEPIYAALEAALKRIGVKTVSRRMKHWSEVAPADQPAIFIAQTGEKPENVKGQPARWRLSVDLFLYVHVGNDMRAVPAQQLNAVLANLRLLLKPSPVTGVVQGFEGLCSHVWIEGEVEVFDGVLGAQAVAVVPVEMLTA